MPGLFRISQEGSEGPATIAMTVRTSRVGGACIPLHFNAVHSCAAAGGMCGSMMLPCIPALRWYARCAQSRRTAIIMCNACFTVSAERGGAAAILTHQVVRQKCLDALKTSLLRDGHMQHLEFIEGRAVYSGPGPPRHSIAIQDCWWAALIRQGLTQHSCIPAYE